MYWLITLILVLFTGPVALAAHDPGELESESKGWLRTQLEQAFNSILEVVKGVFTTAIDGAVAVIRTIVNGAIALVKPFFDAIGQAISGLWTSLRTFLVWFWENLQRLWFYAYNTFGDFWGWIQAEIGLCYEWVGKTLQAIWTQFVDALNLFNEAVMAWVWWIGEYLWNLFQDLLDWLVGVIVDMFGWLIDKLPEIKMPAEYDRALDTFVSYAMILDSVLPVKEVFGLFVIYVTVYAVVTVYRIIKSLIPGLAT